MNRLPFAAALLALAFSACNSASPPPPTAVTPPLLAARLAPAWVSAASRLQTRDRVIYYQGTARPSPSGAQSPAWSGTVTGDVLAIDAQSAILVTGGSLTMAPGGGISVAGPNQVISSDTPAWKHLLAR